MTGNADYLRPFLPPDRDDTELAPGREPETWNGQDGTPGDSDQHGNQDQQGTRGQQGNWGEQGDRGQPWMLQPTSPSGQPPEFRPQPELTPPLDSGSYKSRGPFEPVQPGLAPGQYPQPGSGGYQPAPEYPPEGYRSGAAYAAQSYEPTREHDPLTVGSAPGGSRPAYASDGARREVGPAVPPPRAAGTSFDLLGDRGQSHQAQIQPAQTQPTQVPPNHGPASTIQAGATRFASGGYPEPDPRGDQLPAAGYAAGQASVRAAGAGYAPGQASAPDAGAGYAPPAQPPAAGYTPPSQDPVAGYAPVSQDPAARYAPPSQASDQVSATGYAPAGQYPATGYPPPSQDQSPGYAPPGQASDAGYAQPAQASDAGYAQPAQASGAGYAPPAQPLPAGYAPPAQVQANAYAPPDHNGTQQQPNPYSAPGLSGAQSPVTTGTEHPTAFLTGPGLGGTQSAAVPGQAGPSQQPAGAFTPPGPAWLTRRPPPDAGSASSRPAAPADRRGMRRRASEAGDASFPAEDEPRERGQGGGARSGRWIPVAAAAVVLIICAVGAAILLSQGSKPAAKTGAAAGRTPGPRPTAPSATPPSPTRLITVVPAAASGPDSPAVVAFLTRYFTAINHHDFAAYRKLFSTSLRGGLSQTAFLRGYGSSVDSRATLQSIATAGTGELVAAVTFTSHQEPAASPKHAACTIWTISLYLERQGRDYVIVPPPASYQASVQACS